jgi:myo-inositol-1(or 4)-monophosphatase
MIDDIRPAGLVDDVEAVARAAVLAGGSALAERYRDGDDRGDYGSYDGKAAADEAAEARMLPVVRRAFPDHAVFAEESGTFEGSAPYRWIVDPLDGTNDFADGLPTFASSVAVLADGEPLLAAVYQPASDELYLARRGDGVRYGGDRVTADSDVPLDAATVATIFGRNVPRDPDLAAAADRITDAARDRVTRVLGSWAPTVHSGLAARGRIEGLIEFHPDEEERAVTELFVEEAGAATRRDGPLFVAAPDEATLDALWDAADGAR